MRTVQITQVAPTLGEIVRQSLLVAGIGLLLVSSLCLFSMGFRGCWPMWPWSYTASWFWDHDRLPRGFDSAGVAGFILSIRMAVDTNILIFERIKDEVWNGKTMQGGFSCRHDRALAILDANVTTLIVALVLLIRRYRNSAGVYRNPHHWYSSQYVYCVDRNQDLHGDLVDRKPERIFKRLGGGEVQA